MDFTNYNPNTYMNPYPQINYPTYRQPLSNPMTNQNQLIKVNGIESAKAYPTTPNSMIALFDANEDVFYIKTTDASNYPSLRRFVFTEQNEEEKIQNNYVTLEEFNKFKEEVLNGKQSIRNGSGKSNKSRTNTAEQYSSNQKHDEYDA